MELCVQLAPLHSTQVWLTGPYRALTGPYRPLQVLILVLVLVLILVLALVLVLLVLLVLVVLVFFILQALSVGVLRCRRRLFSAKMAFLGFQTLF